MDRPTNEPTPPPDREAGHRRPHSWRRRVLRWLLRLALALVAILLLYGLAVLVLGAIPVNADHRPPQQGIEILISSNGIHTDFYLPATNATKDWTGYAPLQVMTPYAQRARYVLIGWGDRGFFLDVPSWDDVRVDTTLSALLLPTPSVMHVYYRDWLPARDERNVRLMLREDEYARLVAYLETGFRTGPDGKPILIPDRSYSTSDVFYEGTGSYHLLNTCNNWANRALAAAGVRTPYWSPLDGAIFAQLPR